MKLFTKNKTIRFNLENAELLGYGVEGTVYKFDNYLIKLFNEERLNSLNTLEQLKLLKEIDLKRFVLLTDVLYNKNGKLIGCKMDEINNILPISYLYTRRIKYLIEEILIIYEDLEKLSNNNILIDDIYHNFLFNGNINIIDGSMYKIDYNSFNKNFDYLNDFLIYLIFIKPSKLNINKKTINYIKKNILKDKCLINYLEDQGIDNKIKSLIKKEIIC